MTPEPFLGRMLVALRTALLALVLVAPVGLALPPPSGPSVAPILAVFDPGDATLAGLQAAGYQPCGAQPQGDCYEAVDATGFAAADLSVPRVVFVGTQLLPSPAYDALLARSGDLSTFLDDGGALVALAAPNGAAYKYLPLDQWGTTFTPASHPDYTWSAANDVARTSFGATHPSMAGLTDAMLSGWQPSIANVYVEPPSYLFPTSRVILPSIWGDTQWAATFAGNFRDGCVVVANQPADRLIAGLHGDQGRSSDAAAVIRAHVEWGLDCTQVPPPPLPFTGGVRISGRSNTVTVTHTPNMDCSPVMHVNGWREVTCNPAAPSPDPTRPWGCYGATVLNIGQNMQGLRGSMSCSGNPLADCTAQVVAFGTSSLLHCAQMTGFLNTGPFPIVCRGKPTGTGTWTTTCGSFDP